MPFHKEQVDLINSKLREKLFDQPRFANQQIFGIANIIHVSEDEELDKSFPAIYRDHEAMMIPLDDSYHLMLYHMKSSSRFENVEATFGDGSDIREIASMKMVVFGNRSRLNLSPEELESLIILAMPSEFMKSELSGVKIDRLSVEVNGSDLDSLSVFGEDFSGVPFRLGPNEFLLKIEYNLISVFRRSCINLCDC
jgi:hypothetical protein